MCYGNVVVTDRRDRAFEALADESRRTILRLLSDGDRPVAQIAAELPISRPAVSRHLRLLKEAGLVSERPDGTRRIYRLEQDGMAAVQAYLQTVWGDAAARFRLLAENTDRRAAMTEPPRRHDRGAATQPSTWPAPSEHAFTTWTTRIGSWWPADHTVSRSEDAAVVLQAGVGGRIYERTVDGREHDWGEITAWEPPGAPGLPLASRARRRRRDRGRDPLRAPGRARDPDRDRAPGLGAPRRRGRRLA